MARLSMVEDYIAEVGRRARAGPSDERHAPAADPASARAGFLALAADHVDIDVVPPDTRLRFLKRTISRLTRHITHHQVVVNRALLGAAGVAPAPAPLEDPGSRLAAVVASLEVQVEHLQEEVESLRRQPGVGGLLRGDPTVQLDDDLYFAFEERFRGSRDQIKARLAIYVDDLAEVAGVLGAPVVDLGSGRGELIELLAERGVDSYGVDSNDVMVQRAIDSGLAVEHGDALAHLRGLPDSSVAAVTAIHVIEHLPVADALELVREAGRVLAPGGRLVLETPNPTTVVVGASSFYLDPSHDRPVHPLYLQFLVEHVGFGAVQVRMLHAPEEQRIGPPTPDHPEQVAKAIDAVDWLCHGPADFAVVATWPLDS